MHPDHKTDKPDSCIGKTGQADKNGKTGQIGKFRKRYGVLKKNGEFSYLFKKGQSFGTHAFVCYFKQSRRRVNRAGIITSKKIGNAVKRNRARRVIREAFRLFEPEMRERLDSAAKPVQQNTPKPRAGNVTEKKRYDFIFVARPQTTGMKSTEVYRIMKKRISEKIGI
ncbi:hypothetical protein FACS189499_08320 [Clostridia bacterium]|nr:hypothetical protein FACS189499_08320 [Clostridia bacterium]